RPWTCAYLGNTADRVVAWTEIRPHDLLRGQREPPGERHRFAPGVRIRPKWIGGRNYAAGQIVLRSSAIRDSEACAKNSFRSDLIRQTQARAKCPGIILGEIAIAGRLILP